MALPKWLDRIWLGLIALAFLVLMPLWLMTAGADWLHGILAVALIAVVVWFIIEGFREKPSQGPSTPGPR